MAENKNNAIYVVGHVNPDTDSIAAAMGYAWLLQDQVEMLLPYAGTSEPTNDVGAQSFKIELPMLLTDASPRFASISHRLNTASPDHPCAKYGPSPIAPAGGPLSTARAKPFGLVTVISLFVSSAELSAPIRREEMRIGELMDMPGHEAVDRTVNSWVIPHSGRPESHLARRAHRVWVVDETGRYVGICRHRGPQSTADATDPGGSQRRPDHHRVYRQKLTSSDRRPSPAGQPIDQDTDSLHG